MNKDIRDGKRGDYNPSDYYHNRRIDILFTKARKRAWASIMDDPKVQVIVKDTTDKKIRKYQKKLQTRGSVENLLVPSR
jgi:hypothetical protein